MKTPTDELFELIKSLDKSQKGYFKKHASIHNKKEEAIYFKLFDEIDKQKIYNEFKIKKKFQHEKFVRQLSVTKNYLYQSILGALEDYHADAESELLSFYRQASILFNLGLLDHSQKIISKAKKIARRKEKFALLLLLQRMEWAILFKLRNENAIEHNNQLFAEIKETLEKLENLYSYHFEYVRFFTESQRMGISRDKNKLARLEELMQTKLMSNSDHAKSATAKSIYLKTISTHEFSKGNAAALYGYNKELMLLVEANPDALENKFAYRMSMYHNLANSSLALYQFNETEIWVSKMEEMKAVTTTEKAQQFESLLQLQLSMSLRTAKYSQSVDLVRNMEKEFHLHSTVDPVLKILLIPACASYIEFGAGNYKEALKWVNMVLNHSDVNLRMDVESIIRVMELILHYELGNADLVEYRMKSAYRYLLKKKNLFRSEETLMKYMKKLIAVNDKKEQLGIFTELKNELDELSKDRKEIQFLEMFDISSYLESKLTSESFEQIRRKKLGLS